MVLLMADVNAAFQRLRPICVLVTQNHDVEAISNLEHLLSEDTISNDVLQEMHEYIAFPLRLVLKQYGMSDEAVCIKSLQCLTILFKKISLQKAVIFLDLFSTILNFISTPDKKEARFSEELRYAAVETMFFLFTCCHVSCYSSTLKEALPLFGGLVASLLDIASSERYMELRLNSLGLLHTLVDDRKDKELTVLIAMVVPSYLPGISLNLTKVLTGHAEKAKILVAALKLMRTTLVISLSDCMVDVDSATNQVSTYFSGDSKFIVNKTQQWYEQATKNITLVIKKIADCCITQTSWKVKLELVRWAHGILVNCTRHLPDCRNVLLDIITHNISDGYVDVAECSQSSLREVRTKVQGVAEVLEQRLYDIATTLPRKVSRYDEEGSLSVMKIFNGYLCSLDTDVAALLRCHTHLQRIALALCQLLQLDCTVVNILETSASDNQHPMIMDETFPVLRRQFTSFVDNAVWKEIQLSIHTIANYGDVYTLVDYFICEFQSNEHHRLQCAIILNEMISIYTKPHSIGCSKEVLNTCTAVLELYGDSYRQLLNNYNNTMSISLRNRSTQLQCLIIEGFVVIHQPRSSVWFDEILLNDESTRWLEQFCLPRTEIELLADLLKEDIAPESHCVRAPVTLFNRVTGESYPELLLHTLYSMLESCAHHNVLITQTAVRGLNIISRSFQYSGSAELIEKHCNYLCNALSLNIRRLCCHPTSPAVLSSVLLYSQHTILSYIEPIVIEVLLSLDDHYTDKALSLLRVPQMLVRQLCVWFPPQVQPQPSAHITNCIDSDTQHCSRRECAATPTIDCCDIYSCVADYYKTRVAADDIDFSLEEESETGKHDGKLGNDDPLDEEISKKDPPLFVSLTKKVLERCRHLISHSSPKIRLVTLDIMRDACTVLSHSQDDLLPAVHEVWSGFSKRFYDTELLVIIQAINCLGVLGDLSKDFVRVRVGKEILPNLCNLLHKKSSTSLSTGKAYRHTLNYKLQTVVLETVGKLCVDLKLAFDLVQKVIQACMPYLSIRQPTVLQQMAKNSLEQLAREDVDLVWYLVNELSQGAGTTASEYTQNAQSLLKWINNTDTTHCA